MSKPWVALAFAFVATLGAGQARAASPAVNGYTVDYGQTKIIYAFGVCRAVTNNSPQKDAVFVPTGYAEEWTGTVAAGYSATAGMPQTNGFLQNLPSGVTIGSCYQCTLTYPGPNIAPSCSYTPTQICNNGNPYWYEQWVCCSVGTLVGSQCLVCGVPVDQPYNFNLPAAYNNLNVTISGAGGGGGSASYCAPPVDGKYEEVWGSIGANGGDSTFGAPTPMAGQGGSGGDRDPMWSTSACPKTPFVYQGSFAASSSGIGPMVPTLTTSSVNGGTGGAGGVGGDYGFGQGGGQGGTANYTYYSDDDSLNGISGLYGSISPQPGSTVAVFLGQGGAGAGGYLYGPVGDGQSGNDSPPATISFVTNGTTCPAELDGNGNPLPCSCGGSPLP